MFQRKAEFYVNARAIVERQGPCGTEVLLQVRRKRGEPALLEFPGGRVEPYEPLADALRREILEETGLRVTTFLDALNATRSDAPSGAVECLTPSFAYQTLRGPVDSLGFFFRVAAEGELTEQGDAASGHVWLTLSELRGRYGRQPAAFNWLTRGVLPHYLARMGDQA